MILREDIQIEKRLTGFHLKTVALVSMLVDHFGAVVVWNLLKTADRVNLTRYSGFQQGLFAWIMTNRDMLYSLYELMRLFGRLAFPIYGFLLVEGFVHTRNIKKYAVRLMVFAVVSEVPFDMAFNGSLLEFRYNNVFFTLLLGLLLLWGIRLAEKAEQAGHNRALAILCLGLCTAVAAELIGCDYGGAGVFMVLVMWMLREKHALSYGAGVAVLTWFTGAWNELAALTVLPLIVLYNGQRGKPMKYVFYWFYPVHLLVLTGLTVLLTG